MGSDRRNRLVPTAFALATLVWPPPRAAAQLTPRADLDCRELAEVEELLAGGSPKRSHFLGIEDLFHGLLLGWPVRGGAETAAALSELEQRLSERLECLGGVVVEHHEELPKAGSDRPGTLFMASAAPDDETVPPFVCLAVIQGTTLEPVFDRRADTLLAAARLYQQKHASQLLEERFAYADRSLDQVETLLAVHTYAAGERADTDNAATILSLAAVDLAELRAIRTTEKAAALLHKALDLAPGHLLALYLAAHWEEKLANYPHAREHLEELTRRLPGDLELRLRLAINLARTGEPRIARTRLRELLDAQPDWLAIVAAEELATLLVEDGRTSAASELLEGVIRRFPESSQLRLQLAQTRHTDWRASWPLVDEVLNGWLRDRGEPARVEYERGRPQWIRDTAAQLDERLRRPRAEIVEAVVELGERSERQRMLDSYRLESLCHGVLPLRRLPTDRGPGAFAPGSPGYDG